MRFFSACVAAFVLLWAASADAQQAVTLPQGRYVAVPPAGWDGKAPLPLLLYVHGYGDSPEKLLADQPLMAAMSDAGVLAILPAGQGGAWSFQGSPQRGRDDVAFLHAVVADARQRWPVDPQRVIAAGFSIGGSMVWELACHAADGFTAFLPFSGSFWVPYPERCESGPINLRHVHGTDDHTFPMGGRPIGLLWRQGDTHRGFDILKRHDECPAEPDRHLTQDGLECQIWTGCADGKQLQMCLHTGDHYVNPVWLTDGLAWALSPAVSGP